MAMNSATTTGAAPFHIGLALAGAVSAGAYSAGVFDFLIQALSQWQLAKDTGDPGVPGHAVIVSTIAGASAGGVTGALGVVSTAAGIRPASNADGTVNYVLPELYDAWVRKTRIAWACGDSASLR